MKKSKEIEVLRKMEYAERKGYVIDLIDEINYTTDLRKRSGAISNVELDLMLYKIKGYDGMYGFQEFLIPGIEMLKEQLDREIALYQAENVEEIALELKRARKGV